MYQDLADPYLNCMTECPHTLSEGVLISELLSGSGPHAQQSKLAELLTMRDAAFMAYAKRNLPPE